VQIYALTSNADQDLYFQLIRESNESYVPAATLVRKYVRKGMQVEDKQLLATAA